MGYPNDPYGQGQPYGRPQYGQPPHGQPGYGQQYGEPVPYPDGAFAPSYQFGGYPPVGGFPPPYPNGGFPPPPRRFRAPVYVAVGLAAALVVGVGVAVPLILANSEKPPPTASASRLILDEDDFAEYDGEFTELDDEGVSFRVDATPSECDFLVAPERPSDAEYAWALWEDGDGDKSASLFVEKWADDQLATVADVVKADCSSFSYVERGLDFEDEPTDVDVEVVPAEGAPSGTVSTMQVRRNGDGDKRSFRVLEAVVRGTTIRLGFGFDGSWSDRDEQDAVELFNKQITKIREAE